MQSVAHVGALAGVACMVAGYPSGQQARIGLGV
jgi:hypothetical protein